MGLEVDVEIDQVPWNANTLHFQRFEDNSLTMLALVKGGVVIADVVGSLKK